MRLTLSWGQELHQSHQLSSRALKVLLLLPKVLLEQRVLLQLEKTHFRKRRVKMGFKVTFMTVLQKCHINGCCVVNLHYR